MWVVQGDYWHFCAKTEVVGQMVFRPFRRGYIATRFTAVKMVKNYCFTLFYCAIMTND